MKSETLVSGTVKTILVDMSSGEVFSEREGWNKTEITLKTVEEWSFIIYTQISPLGKDQDLWKNRKLYCVPFIMPVEPEMLF